MTINKTKEDSKLTVQVEGRIDTTTAPQLESEIKDEISGITDLVIDLKEVAYVSSAGLRVLLSAQKVMNRQGNMVIKNVNEEVMEIFEVTGFIDILNIEE